MERESIVAETLEGADGVAANLLAAAVVFWALILIWHCEKKCFVDITLVLNDKDVHFVIICKTIREQSISQPISKFLDDSIPLPIFSVRI